MPTLVVGTWNCFGQAQDAVDAITAVRAPYGARLRDRELPIALGTAHVLSIQELLSREAEAFFDSLEGVRLRDRNRVDLRRGTMRGSGLGVVARGVEIGEPTIEPFSSPSVSWDRFARKGTMHVRVRVGEVELDVVDVHLQSGYDAAARATRSGQIGELAARIERLGDPTRPFVVCGDLNVDGLGRSGDEYRELRRALVGFDDLGEQDDLATFDPHPERNCLAWELEPEAPVQRVDYVLVRPARTGRARVRAEKVTRILDRPLGSTPPPWSARARRAMPAAYASDHYGIVATLEVSND